jgi:hypothetical protein
MIAVIVLAREVFVCKCATDVGRDDPSATEEVQRVRWVSGKEAHLSILPPEHHSKEHIEELRERLVRGEHWVLGLLDDKVVSYTWLHKRRRIEYPYLPGCAFETADDVGYGYDAWTPPELRGGGLRRRGFLEELNVLKEMGCHWEASFFVKHQLEGAMRSLAKVGIVIVPLWRVQLQRDRKLSFENLATGDASTQPITSAEPVS